MDFQPINTNVVPLLHGLKPYLGTKGQLVTEGLTSLVNLLSSEHGQEAIRTMSRTLTATGKGDKVFTVNTPGGPVTFSLGIEFTLFLILILLILSGSFLAMGSGSYGGYPGSTVISEEAEEDPSVGEDTISI
ncbi:MAG TPA: hypothetical protein VNT57_04690 [Desulfobacteria bacterium]|nr:hypothetical protein [Desulfobacteria bacterium]